jgi:flagellar biosynthetic protein FliR
MPSALGSVPLEVAALEAAAFWQLIACAGLLAVRLAPLVLLAPWLLAGLAPRLVQLAIGLVLVVCLLPSSAAALGALPTSPLPWLALAARELMIGLVLGLSLALPVHALRWAGDIIQAALGESFAFDPATQGESALEPHEPPIAKLYGFLAVALFVTLGGHRLAISAIGLSLQAAPLGTLTTLRDPAALALGSVTLLGSAFTTATFIALPVMLVLALTDVSLALLARLAAAPLLPALAPSVRPIVLLGVIWIGLMALVDALPEWFRQSIEAATRLWGMP